MFLIDDVTLLGVSWCEGAWFGGFRGWLGWISGSRGSGLRIWSSSLPVVLVRVGSDPNKDLTDLDLSGPELSCRTVTRRLGGVGFGSEPGEGLQEFWSHRDAPELHRVRI